MPQRSNALIERISDDHHIDFNRASDAEKILIYKLVLREIFTNLLRTPAPNIPIEALRDIQDTLNRILSGFYDLLSRDIRGNIYQDINKVIPSMQKAIAFLNAALTIYNDGQTAFQAEQMRRGSVANFLSSSKLSTFTIVTCKAGEGVLL